MNRIHYTERADEDYAELPADIRKAFLKQIRLLAHNLRHPSLHAKKYNEADDIWQARVNRNWRFYFRIIDNDYWIISIIPHPK